MTSKRHFVLAALAAPLALALSACSDEPAEGDGALTGDAIAAIPAPEGTSWLETTTVSDKDGYVLGNPDAPLKLIEYASLTCGACANFAMTGMEPLKSEYVSTGVVSYELRNQVHNAYDLTLARLVRCSQPESMHALSEQVWTNFETVMAPTQQNPDLLSQAMSLPENQRFVAMADGYGMLDFFAARGISSDQAMACLSDSASVMQIAENSDTQSAELGVTSTPTFILNGRVLEERGWDQLKAVLERAGARPAS